jgi:8-oxo-dGTP pyrophosphatase MutT (NUDIX family)
MNGIITIPQSAVLGYRIVGKGTKVLLVTSRTRGRWVLPKGMIAEGMTPAESAIKEAWEEAGVAGTVSGGCLGVYRYIKTRRIGVRACVVKVYAMKVTAVLPTWPEQRLRRRRWMSIDEAICKVMNRDLKRLLITFSAKRRSQRMVRLNGSDPGVSARCCMACHGFAGHGFAGEAMRGAIRRPASRAPGQIRWRPGAEQATPPSLRPEALKTDTGRRAPGSPGAIRCGYGRDLGNLGNG